MTFATVKSDPYKKKVKRPRRRFSLWTDKFWKQLVNANSGPLMNDRQLELIRSENGRLYGT